MVNMEETLLHFQNAMNTGIRVHRLLTDDEMVMKIDYPDGGARITHALIEEQKVIGLVAYAIEPPYEGIECWNVGYVVLEERRNQGLAKDILNRSLTDFTQGMARQKKEQIIITASIDKNNVTSQHVAEHCLGNERFEAIDESCGTPIFVYQKLFQELC